MARRPRAAKASRAQGPATAPTPIQSTHTTPASSAFPSAYPSDAEFEGKDAVEYIPTIRRLTMMDFNPNKPKKVILPPRDTSKPFPFLDLPVELRVKVYEYHFASSDPVLDLHHEHFKRQNKRLAILRTCRTVYEEASHFFYNTQPVRVFPTHPGRYFRSKKPLLARLKPHQRSSIGELELRLGPGFNKPPQGWVVNAALGLKDCASVRKLSVFVQIDPSVSWLDGFRMAGFYESFSCNLLNCILTELPNVQRVEFDAYESVKKSCPIMRELLDVTSKHGKKICWGPKRGWTDEEEEEQALPGRAGEGEAFSVALMDGAGAIIAAAA